MLDFTKYSLIDLWKINWNLDWEIFKRMIPLFLVLVVGIIVVKAATKLK